MTVNDRPLIVLSLEGLATSALGCYGSSWNRTPAIDAIAGNGCVWDRRIATWDDPRAVLADTIDSSTTPWSEPWRCRGSVELLTDVESAVDGVPQSCFDCIDTIDGGTPSEVAAEDIVETQLGQLIAAAIERDTQPEPWSVLWLHSDYLTRRWDAPRHLFPLEEELLEMEEPSEEIELLEAETDVVVKRERPPAIFETVIPPSITLPAHADPDLVTSWMRTYGCQIRLLDVLMEVLLNSLRVQDPCFVLTGTSGFRLGQGGRIGHRVGPLRSPDIRLPLIVSDCGPLRIPQLTPSSALSEVLRDLGHLDAGPLIAPNDGAELASRRLKPGQPEHTTR